MAGVLPSYHCWGFLSLGDFAGNGCNFTEINQLRDNRSMGEASHPASQGDVHKFTCVKQVLITLWLFNMAMENGPFIDGLPIKNDDFPWLC